MLTCRCFTIAALGSVLVLGVTQSDAPAADPPAPPPPSERTTAPSTPTDAAAAAALEAMGSRGVRLHDPSAIVRCKDEYWLFYTGANVPSYRSKDLRNWEPGPRAFAAAAPPWVRESVPRNRNGNDFWAPEIVRAGDRYLLYYSVSSWGRNDSAIALAINTTLDPADPAYRWIDEGIVIGSKAGADNFNAIDPAVALDADGRMWLSFGSFWGGIRLVELDPKTGKRLAPDSPIHALAWKQQIEGPFIHRREGKYYLFVAWGWCCRGVNSTYNVRVGRSEKITGPYLDRDGKDMRDGGGTLVADTDGAFIGPGQPSIFTDDTGHDSLVCHFYDATRRGRSTLAIRPLVWDADAWPSLPLSEPAEAREDGGNAAPKPSPRD